MIDLAIEEDLQIEINATLAYNNQKYWQWCSLSDGEINKNKVKSQLHMIWDGRIYHMEGDMTPLTGMPS